MSLLDAKTWIAGNQSFAFVGHGALAGAGGSLQVIEVGGSSYVNADVDGNGIADFQLLVSGVTGLTRGRLPALTPVPVLEPAPRPPAAGGVRSHRRRRLKQSKQSRYLAELAVQRDAGRTSATPAAGPLIARRFVHVVHPKRSAAFARLVACAPRFGAIALLSAVINLLMLNGSLYMLQVY